jgi:hypothetical protein
MGFLGGELALFQFFQLRLDTTVSLQALIGIVAWGVTVVVYFTNVRNNIGTLQTYVDTHTIESNQRDEKLEHLALISERLTTLVENITERVERVERTCERRHNGRS